LTAFLRTVEEAEQAYPRSVIAVGNFDGVHRGHEVIIERVVERAIKLGTSGMVVTFDPHPQQYLGRKPPLSVLTPIERKLELLSKYDLDAVLIISFTQRFAKITAEEFVKLTYVRKLEIQEIVVGYSHKFGEKGKGDQLLLKRLGNRYGFLTHIVDPIERDGVLVNSSRIRNLLNSGEIIAARNLLGHPYTISGTVVPGDGQGSKMSYPTANLELNDPNWLKPKRGVYAVRVNLGQKVLNGVMNIGIRPTFKKEIEQCEVHIMNFEGDIYGRIIHVEVVDRIRDEIKFSSVDKLKLQILKDVETSYNILKV